MESYGLELNHILILEKFVSLPIWKSLNTGTLVYDMATKRCYLGGLSSWELLGLDTRIVKANHIFTDDSITGSKNAISALDIPIVLDNPSILDGINYDGNFYSFDTTSNVQFTLDAINRTYSVTKIELDPNIVTSEIVDWSTDIASTISIYGIDGKQYSIFGYLQTLLNRDAISIDVDWHSFGYDIGLEAETVDGVLCRIEQYLSEIEARDITNTLPDISDKCDLQSTFDYIKILQDNFEFIKLDDMPVYYHDNILYAIRSNGSTGGTWEDIAADNVHVDIPNYFNPIRLNVSSTITNSVSVYDPETETSISISNIFDLTKLQHTPSDYFSTSVQHALNLVCEIVCIQEPRAMACTCMPIIDDDNDLERLELIEQHKEDSKCCSITDNNYDEDWSYVLNGWIKFSHGRESNVQPYEPPEGFGYEMTSDGDGIMASSDSHSHNGRISHNSYECFEFEVTVSSITEDNDMIGIVIAWHVDENGHEHTLSAWRSHGTVETYTGVWDGNGPYVNTGTYADPSPDYLGTHTQWCLVYNYRQFTEWLIADGNSAMIQANTDDQWTPGGGWSGDFSRIKVRRKLDQIDVWATNWSTEKPFIGHLSVNLNSDPRLYKFKGPKQYGYGQHSTQWATWARQVIKCLDCGTTDCKRINDMNLNGVEIVDTTIEANELKDQYANIDTHCNPSCINSVPLSGNIIDFTDVFNNWQRWATNNYDTSYWELSGGSIHSTANFSYECHFLSPIAYDKYSFELTVRSGESDDDFIYIVICHNVITNDFLLAVRNKGANNQVGEPLPTYFISRNGMSDIIASSQNIEIGGVSNWDGDFTRLFACRYENIVSIACSPFNSEILDENTIVTIDLNMYPEFLGPQRVGFGCGSQNDSWFSSPDLHVIGPPDTVESILGSIPLIFDKSESTLWRWIFQDCMWSPEIIDTPCGGIVGDPTSVNPGTIGGATTCVELDNTANLIYDIRNNDIWKWDPIVCIWDTITCPVWEEFIPNTIYYNCVTCKIFYYTCEKEWVPLN